jgi:hypothetical protein
MFQDMMSLLSDLAQRMKPTWIFKLVADDLQQSVQEEVFDKVPHAHVHEAVFDTVPPAQEVHEKNDIITLCELAEKIMKVVREAEGDVGDETAIEEQDDDGVGTPKGARGRGAVFSGVCSGGSQGSREAHV